MYARDSRLIQKKYAEYILPSVLSTAALSVASMVDNILVGNLLGGTALSGVGACSPVIALINALFMLFTVGGATCASVARGQREREKADAFFTLSLSIGFAVMVLFVAVMELAARPVCALMCRADPSLAPLMLAYLRPVLFVGPALFLTLGFSQFMRLDGRPKAASVVALVSNLVNLALDYIFIRFLNLGLTGAGLSTTLGYVAGIVCVLPWLRSKERTFRLTAPRPELLPQVLSSGSSRMLVNLCDFAKRQILNTLVLGSLGKEGLAVLTICNSLVFFSTSITNGGSDAFLPIAGSLYGERDYFGLRACVREALKWVMGGCAVLTALLLAAPQAVGFLYGVRANALLPPAVRMLSLYLPLMGMLTVIRTFYNTTGRKKLASLVSVLDSSAYISVFAVLFSLVSSNLIWLCYVCSGLSTLLTVLLLGRHVRRKEGAEGFLLLQPPEKGSVSWDATIPATGEAAAGISEAIIRFCAENGVDSGKANRIGVATEEMAVSAAQAQGGKGGGTIMDIRLLIGGDGVALHFRDNGVPLDPTAAGPEHPPQQGDSIEVMKRMARSVEYSRQLGFNTVILHF